MPVSQDHVKVICGTEFHIPKIIKKNVVFTLSMNLQYTFENEITICFYLLTKIVYIYDVHDVLIYVKVKSLLYSMLC